MDNLTQEEATQEVKERLKNQLIGDRLVIEKDDQGFSVHMEFHEKVGQVIKSEVRIPK